MKCSPIHFVPKLLGLGEEPPSPPAASALSPAGWENQKEKKGDQMGKAVAHFSKSKSSGGGSGKEIDRYVYPGECKPGTYPPEPGVVSHHGDLHKAVEDRIEEGYTGKTAIRKDAVKSITLILSGSHEDMKAIEKAGNLDKWVKANHDFLSERYGSKNIASLYLHLDETTPHLHATIVPLTKDGRLRQRN